MLIDNLQEFLLELEKVLLLFRDNKGYLLVNNITILILYSTIDY